MMATGTARLAAATDALVLPGGRELRRYRPVTVLEAPLDPRDHSGWQSLHQAIADRYSKRILADPAVLEDPRRGGAWEDGATADAWLLPR